MSEISPANPVPDAQAGTDVSSLRSMAMLAYLLLLLSCATGLTAVGAVILAYVKKRDALGTVWQSHFHNVIVVFWAMLVVFLVRIITLPISLAYFFAYFYAHDFVWPSLSALSVPFLFWLVIFPVFLIWVLYRTIRGLVRAGENRAY
jgi:uncharacterized membrane protein